MKLRFPFRLAVAGGVLAVIVAGIAGCSKSEGKSTPPAVPLKPKAAANQLQQAFAQAPPDLKQTAAVASQSMQSADYEGAVQAIQIIKATPNLSLDQGMAVHASEVSLENRLINAMAAGDPKAKQAYELLKKSHKN